MKRSNVFYASRIPESTKAYLRPWQTPELLIADEVHYHDVVLFNNWVGSLCAGPGALAEMVKVTGYAQLPEFLGKQPTDVILYLKRPTGPGVWAGMTYADFEWKMDKLGLDSVTTTGFYPFWLREMYEAIHGPQPELIDGRINLPYIN